MKDDTAVFIILLIGLISFGSLAIASFFFT